MEIKNKLETALYETHYQAARRPSSSTQALLIAWQSNGGDLMKSITCAMMTLGGAHAPIKPVYKLLHGLCSGSPDRLLVNYKIIPGFGSSFIKGEPDPLLNIVRSELCICDKKYIILGDAIQTFLKEYRGLDLYPNLAFYTAAVSHALTIPIELCERIMLQARMKAWLDILNGTLTILEQCNAPDAAN